MIMRIHRNKVVKKKMKKVFKNMIVKDNPQIKNKKIVKIVILNILMIKMMVKIKVEIQLMKVGVIGKIPRIKRKYEEL